MNYYIKQNKALKKLKFAWEINSFVYIYGATGYGKTELIKNFLKGKKYHYFSSDEHYKIRELEEEMIESKKLTTVVIDDIQFLNEEYRDIIKNLIYRSDLWVVLISRSNVPRWLIETFLNQSFITISEKDLSFSGNDIKQILENFQIKIPEEEINYLAESTQGNPYIMKYVISRILSGIDDIFSIREETTRFFEDYLENSVICNWDSDIKDFLLQMSLVKEFTVELAKTITGNHDINELIDKSLETGNFINISGEIYTIRQPLFGSLNKIAYKTYSKDSIKEKLYNAGLYYEMNGLDVKALDMYVKCNNTNRIKDLIIRNSKKNPSAGYYYEMRDYYFLLDEEEVKSSIELMSALSMLNSLMLNIEKSEYWYNCLKAKLEKTVGKEKTNIKSILLYLDIALPHRGSKNTLGLLQKCAKLMSSNAIYLPEFSVTSNMPSLMNGGKDFCHWSKNDKTIAKLFGNSISWVLGKYGKGLVNVAISESYYEKSMDSYEISSRLSRAKLETESAGKIELEFVIVSIQARMYIFDGEINSAEELILSFRKKAINAKKNKLIEQIDTFLCRIYLYRGEIEKINSWLETAPNENINFFIMDRYHYICKIRCYIAMDKLSDAYSLNEKLLYYAERYERRYIKMQCNLISAIIKYRKGDNWQEGFLDTLQEINKYNFTKIISEEGSAINPLLIKFKTTALNSDRIDREWYKNVVEETGSMAIKYNAYLKSEVKKIPNFSENALSVLRLQSEGLSNTEIAKELGLNPYNVRYHIKENYKKLGVNTKTNAIILAKNLNII